MVPKHDDHAADVPRYRIVAGAFLLGVAAVGIAANLATGQERFPITFCVAFLTSGLGCLGVGGVNLRGT